MLKKIVITVYKAPQKVIAQILKISSSFFGFLFDKASWIVHAIILLYVFNHLHIFDDREVFEALGPEEKTKQLKAVTLLLGLLVYWGWVGLKSLFRKNNKNVELPSQTKE